MTFSSGTPHLYPKPTVFTLMGPTASGKTRIAIALRRELNVELISVDSSLVYKGMDIGSAKPTFDELAQAPHRLIDIRDPAEPYSAADFCRDAKTEINDIIAKGKTPLLVGGSMLYFRALLDGLSPMPEVDPRIRAKILKDAESLGWPAMHEKLMDIDPGLAIKLHPNHSHRIARALEVFIASGKTMSSWREESGDGLLSHFDWRQVALIPSKREILHDDIERRFDLMLEQGFIAEVKKLKQRGDLNADLPSIRAVGYRQAWQYLQGELNADDMRAKTIAASRQLAKRQLTWLRSWPNKYVIDPYRQDGTKCTEQEILSKCLPYLVERDI